MCPTHCSGGASVCFYKMNFIFCFQFHLDYSTILRGHVPGIFIRPWGGFHFFKKSLKTEDAKSTKCRRWKSEIRTENAASIQQAREQLWNSNGVNISSWRPRQKLTDLLSISRLWNVSSANPCCEWTWSKVSVLRIQYWAQKRRVNTLVRNTIRHRVHSRARAIVDLLYSIVEVG